mgnify:CR=1 FL=1
MANAVLVNLKDGRFADGGASAGDAFARKAVHRGVAFGDVDNDGRVDAVVTALDGPLELWRNVSPVPSHWLSVKTVGTRSPRDGLGAKIKVVTAAGAQYDHVSTSVGYGGASDRRVHFGLGADEDRPRADDHLVFGQGPDAEGRRRGPGPDGDASRD